MQEYSIPLLAIIVVTCLFSWKGFTDEAFKSRYLFNVGRIRAGEQYRMFTSGLLHADVFHLFFNMFTLFMFAPLVILGFGNWQFILIYLVSLIAGSLLSLLVHREESWYSALGASGAVTGVLYSAILLQPDMNVYLFFIPIGVPAYLFGLIYMLYSIYGMKNRHDNIGHTAHFGGAIGGYAMTLAYRPMLFSDHPLTVILLAIPIVLLFFLERKSRP